MITHPDFVAQQNKKTKLILMTLFMLCGGAILTVIFRNLHKTADNLADETTILNPIDEPYAIVTSQHLRKLTADSVKKPTIPAKKMNVVFYIFDDLGGVRIDPNINANQALHGKTPGFNKMISRSVVFPRTKTTVPVCGPSRIALLTSTKPQIFNFESNWYQLNQTSVMGTLVKQGYKYVHVEGKVNHELPQPPSIRKMQLLYNMNETTTSAGTLQAGNSECGNLLFCTLKASQLVDYKVVGGATAFIKQMQQRPADEQAEPFAIFIGQHRPHTFYAVDKAFANYLPGDIPNLSAPIIDVPAKQFPLALKECDEIGGVKYSSTQRILNKDRPVASDICNDLPLTKLIRKSYQNAVAWTDSMFNQFLETLDASPYAGNTLIVLTADHGFNLGEGCEWCKGLLFDESTIVPLMISAPGIQPGVASTLASHLDVVPTMYELLFGANFVQNFRHPSGEALAGTSLVPALYNNAAQINEFIFSQYGRCQPPTTTITMSCTNDNTNRNGASIPCTRPPLLFMGYEATSIINNNSASLECRYVAWWPYKEVDVCAYPKWWNQPKQLNGYGTLSNQVIFSKSGTVWGDGTSIPGHKEFYCHPAGALYGDPGYPTVNSLAHNPTAANQALMNSFEAAIVKHFKPTAARI